MPNAVESLLNKLDGLIQTRKLHAGDARTPVQFTGLLEDAVIWHAWLPEPVFGISTFYKGDAGVVFNKDLQEPERIADRRYVCGHEFGHIISEHEGQFAVWTTAGRDTSFPDRRVTGWQEREADVIAAYVFVPFNAIEEMAGMDAAYIAAVLDVPEYLVSLRWKIKEKYGK